MQGREHVPLLDPAVLERVREVHAAGKLVMPAFVDPAKYDLYNCTQLQTERTALAIRAAELQGLMAKADTGAAGPVVAEFAYRNDFITARAQAKLADEAWRRNKCQDTLPAAAPPPSPAPPADAKQKHPHQHSGSGLY